MSYGEKVLSNSQHFDALLEVLRMPPTEEEREILAGETEEGEEEWEDSLLLSPEIEAELEAIEAEIEEELLEERRQPQPNPEGELRREQLDALVMSRARGVGALLGFAQNTVRPTWIRARAFREIIRLEGNDNALAAGAFHLGAEAIPADMPRAVDLEGVLLEKDRNEMIHAHCLTRPGSGGYALEMDIKEEKVKAGFGENALLHVTLFDRESGASFKQAVAKMRRVGEAFYHVDLFDPDNLSRADLERAEAVFWVEKPGAENEAD